MTTNTEVREPMTEPSGTPRTDAAAFDQVCCCGEYPVKRKYYRKYYTEGDYVEADDARKLELELAEEREANRISAEHVGVRIFIDPLNRHIAVNERAEQAEREREELAEALTTLLNAVEGNHVTQGDCNQARAALAKVRA